MNAKLTGLVFTVEAIKERNIDRQLENIYKIKGVVDIGFQRGLWGDPDTLTVTFDVEDVASKEQPLHITKKIDAINKAISRARKVKSNDDSQTYHDDFKRWNDELHRRERNMRVGFYVTGA
jgi:hypothetical protein